MAKFLEKIRTIIMIVFIIVALVLTMLRLMKLQIVQGEEFLRQSMKKTIGVQEIIAPRGEIIDKNGQPLVQNKDGFNVVIEKAFFPSNIAQQNEIILKTARIVEELNSEWIENIPISKEKPYTYLEDKNSDIAKLKDNLRLNTYATPQNCIDKLVEMYEISDEYTDEEVRIIAGIRYEMIYTQFSVGNRYVFAEDVPIETVSKIKELSYMLDGVDVVESPIREYVDGTIFPHGLGTIGPIYAEEYAELKEQGYKFDDVIGKSGIEKIMESELRGENGEREVVISSSKHVVSMEDTIPIVPGNTVQLTIDSEFQKEVQDILANTITSLQDDPSGLGKGVNACAGSIVVLDVKTGAVLAMVTYPSYDINDYLGNYSELLQRDNDPLVNRAIDGLYRPGSTFKPITATTALNEGIITKDTTEFCGQTYHYLDTDYHCTHYHGELNVVTAIEKSCNIFFYKVGLEVGIDLLNEYEEYFGFGVPLNFELGGKTGYLACPDTFARFGMQWNPGEMLNASIGQSEIGISPLNMAVEAMTLANNGIRYRPYIIDSIWSYDRSELVSKTQPIIDYQIKDKTGETFETVRLGMKAAAQNTIWSPFTTNKAEDSLKSGTGLPFDVAIKTGTPQRSVNTDSAVIGYYPADDPEIAFAAFIEQGEYSKYMLRDVIDAYYGYNDVVQN